MNRRAISRYPYRVMGRETWLPMDFGFNRNRNTASSTLTRLTGKFYASAPMLVERILWDIRNSGTYTLQFVTTLTGTTVIKTVLSGKVVSAGADDVEFTPTDGPFTIPIGVFFLQLNRDTGATSWWDYSATIPVYSTYLLGLGGAYDTTVYESYSAPARFIGSYLNDMSGISLT